MTRLVKLTFAILAVFTLAMMPQAEEARAADLEKVQLTLNWVPYGLHVGPVIAKQQGLYEAAGLDVEILRGYGSGESVKRVALGTSTFALADATSVVFGRSEGLNVKMIGTILDKSGNAVYYRQDSGIKSPTDLEGKKVASTPGSSYFQLFPVYAEQAGIDDEKIEWVPMNAPSVIPSFASGKVDAMLTFTTEQPNIISATEKTGTEWGRFLFADAGVDIYSVSIIASDEMISSDPEMVRKFVNATIEGYRRAVTDPEAAADAFVKAFPENNRDLVLAQWQAAMELFITDVASEKGLGYMTEEKVAATLEAIRSFAEIDASVAAADLYTMDFLEPHMLAKQ